MADSFVGEVRIFGFNYAPYDWAYCIGTTMAPSQNPALFSLIGNIYGGDGKTSFKLPNLTGRGVTGTLAGSPQYGLGKTQGDETVTLTESNLPNHNHNVNAEIQPAAAQRSGTPSATVLPGRCMDATSPKQIYTDASTPLVQMAGGPIAANGSGLPHENRQPLLAMNFCISLAGTYPSFD